MPRARVRVLQGQPSAGFKTTLPGCSVHGAAPMETAEPFRVSLTVVRHAPVMVRRKLLNVVSVFIDTISIATIS